MKRVKQDEGSLYTELTYRGTPMIAEDIPNLTPIPITGWFCSVCDEYAQVMMSGETLCRDHAKRYRWGYGEQLLEMRKQYE